MQYTIKMINKYLKGEQNETNLLFFKHPVSMPRQTVLFSTFVLTKILQNDSASSTAIVVVWVREQYFNNHLLFNY